jgi:predicted RNase H-like nuclease (RuvC/YqgF family)
VIAALVALIISVTGPVVRLNSNITRLNVVMENMKSEHLEQKAEHRQDMLDIKNGQDEKLKRVYGRIEPLEKGHNDHEKRIIKLEEKRNG